MLVIIVMVNNSSQCCSMNCQKAMTLPLKEEEASPLDPKAKVKAMQVVQQTSTLMVFLVRSSMVLPTSVPPTVLVALHPLHLQQKQKERTSVEPP
jgi:hypothetical protein